MLWSSARAASRIASSLPRCAFREPLAEEIAQAGVDGRLPDTEVVEAPPRLRGSRQSARASASSRPTSRRSPNSLGTLTSATIPRAPSPRRAAEPAGKGAVEAGRDESVARARAAVVGLARSTARRDRGIIPAMARGRWAARHLASGGDRGDRLYLAIDVAARLPAAALQRASQRRERLRQQGPLRLGDERQLPAPLRAQPRRACRRSARGAPAAASAWGSALIAVWAVSSGLLAFFPDDPVGTKTHGLAKVHLAARGDRLPRRDRRDAASPTRASRREPGWRPRGAALIALSWVALVPCSCSGMRICGRTRWAGCGRSCSWRSSSRGCWSPPAGSRAAPARPLRALRPGLPSRLPERRAAGSGSVRVIEVRRVCADEWEALREVRLRALAEAPEAFETRFEDASLRPEQWWREWAERSARGAGQAMFLAWDGVPAGIGGILAERGRFRVISIWVDPGRRGEGIGSALLEAAVGFAGERGGDPLGRRRQRGRAAAVRTAWVRRHRRQRAAARGVEAAPAGRFGSSAERERASRPPESASACPSSASLMRSLQWLG